MIIVHINSNNNNNSNVFWEADALYSQQPRNVHAF